MSFTPSPKSHEVYARWVYVRAKFMLGIYASSTSRDTIQTARLDVALGSKSKKSTANLGGNQQIGNSVIQN